MDEQTNSAHEPVTTTPDPIAPNTPITEPLPIEPTEAPIETVIIPEPEETPQTTAPPEPITELPTAQLVENEPLPKPTQSAGVPAEAPQSQTPTPTQGSTSQPEPIPAPISSPAPMPAQAPVVTTPPRNIARLFLEKAKAVIQLRKQKKLLKIMGLFAKKSHITNDEVEKLLHVSDATATRYLSHLEQQGKIKQTGKTGKGVSYTKV